MNGHTSASQYVYIFPSVAQWFRHWPVMKEVGSCFEPSDRQGFSSFSFYSFILTCKHTCKLDFMRFMIKSCLIKNIATKQVQVFYYTSYRLTLLEICLVMRNHYIHTNMKLKINKDVE